MRIVLRAAFVAACLLLTAGAAQAQDKIGVLLLHGKNPGNPNDPNIGNLKSKLDGEGMITLLPEMPWAARRYIDGDWDKAMAEIDGHVKTLRSRGATKIAIAGHSMGSPAAIGYAATRPGAVDAIALLAPGHTPDAFFQFPTLKAVRDSIEEAKRMVTAGQGDTKRDFNDVNQGKVLLVRMTAKDYLSYFDQGSGADMLATAPKLPATTAVLWVVGNDDPIFHRGRSTYFSKLPANPKNQYVEITATHFTTPVVARDAIADWIKSAVAQ